MKGASLVCLRVSQGRLFVPGHDRIAHTFDSRLDCTAGQAGSHHDSSTEQADSAALSLSCLTHGTGSALPLFCAAPASYTIEKPCFPNRNQQVILGLPPMLNGHPSCPQQCASEASAKPPSAPSASQSYIEDFGQMPRSSSCRFQSVNSTRNKREDVRPNSARDCKQVSTLRHGGFPES